MSKRHGATSVQQYRDLGYLPEALVNFLALLGWSPVGEEEIFSLDELIAEFSMDRVAKNPAVFDVDKLNYINSTYIKKASPERILELAMPHLKEAGYVDDNVTTEKKAWLVEVMTAVQEYLSYAAQVVDHVDIFFNEAVQFENDEAREVLRDADVARVIEVFKEKMTALDTVDVAGVKAVLKSMVKELKLGGKKVYMPIRVALTGKMHGPELFHIIPIIGRDKAVARIDTTMAKI